MDTRDKKEWKSLKLGIWLVAISYVPWAFMFAFGALALSTKASLWTYLSMGMFTLSWVIFILGLIIGGPEAVRCARRFARDALKRFRKKDVPSHTCPLCRTMGAEEFAIDKQRSYFHCLVCSLVFVPKSQFLSEEEEKSRYDLHQNNSDDPEYRKFLNRLFAPMQERLAPKSVGLDFGSGPGPTLSVMFEEAGHTVELYDYFYAKKPEVLEKEYDFITATEVIEHLHNPRKELKKLWQCLKPGGHLGVMTKLVLDRDAFEKWHYKNDDTHVVFFSRQTFEWLASKRKAEITFIGDDVIILKKKE